MYQTLTLYSESNCLLRYGPSCTHLTEEQDQIIDNYNTSRHAATKDLNRCNDLGLILLYIWSSSLITRQFHRQSSNIRSRCWDVHDTISDYVKQNPYTESLVVHDLFYYSPSYRTRRESPTQVLRHSTRDTKDKMKDNITLLCLKQNKTRSGQVLLFLPRISIDVCSLALTISKPPSPWAQFYQICN